MFHCLAFLYKSNKIRKKTLTADGPVIPRSIVGIVVLPTPNNTVKRDPVTFMYISRIIHKTRVKVGMRRFIFFKVSLGALAS